MFRSSKILTILFVIFASTNLGSVAAITINSFDGSTTISAPPAPIPVLSSSASAIGGSRSLAVKVVPPSGSMAMEIVGGRLEYSQTASAAAAAEIIWDGDNDPVNFRPAGLGGIDFTQDNGQSIVLQAVNPDHQVLFRLRLYDANDPLGNSYLEAIKIEPADLNPHSVTIPFSSFVAVGSATLAGTIKRVGAVSLTIDGTQSAGLDVGIGAIGTNGSCNLVPSSTQKVVDDCGVCGGNNQNKDSCGVCNGQNAAKDQCGVCFGNNKDLDQCGVCFGNNKLVDSCGVCNGGNKLKDLCGVCGGNGISCLDCKGMAFGSAKIDNCGVCGGNNTTCKNCAEIDVKSANTSVYSRLKAQYFYDKKVWGGLKSQAEQIKKARQVLALAKKVSLKMPSSYTSCTGLMCSQVRINRAELNALKKYSKALYIVGGTIIEYRTTVAIEALGCSSATEVCIQKEAPIRAKDVIAKARAKRLWSATLVRTRRVPKTESVCK